MERWTRRYFLSLNIVERNELIDKVNVVKIFHCLNIECCKNISLFKYAILSCKLSVHIEVIVQHVEIFCFNYD